MRRRKRMRDTALELFRTAGMYGKAARILNAHRPGLLIPSTVMAAFTLELYFKSLYVLERHAEFRVKGRRSHDFYALFEDLSDSIQQELTRDFASGLAARDMRDIREVEETQKMAVPRDLKSNLKGWSGGFAQLRYVHEFIEKEKGTPWAWCFFPEIEASVVAAVTRRQPTWRGV
jgi:hypothetical protein